MTMTVFYDLNTKTLAQGEKFLALSGGEERLMNLLTATPRKIVKHREFVESGVLDATAAVKRLRRTAEARFGVPLPIEAARQQGYLWSGGVRRAVAFAPVELVGQQRERHEDIVERLHNRKFARLGHGSAGPEIVEVWVDPTGRFAIVSVDAIGEARLLWGGTNWRAA